MAETETARQAEAVTTEAPGLLDQILSNTKQKIGRAHV